VEKIHSGLRAAKGHWRNSQRDRSEGSRAKREGGNAEKKGARVPINWAKEEGRLLKGRESGRERTPAKKEVFFKGRTRPGPCLSVGEEIVRSAARKRQSQRHKSV